MMRRLFAAAAVLMLSGLLPLAAMAGFCASRACCHSQSPGRMASLGAAAGCCNETNCETSARSGDATVAKITIVQPPQFVAAEAAVRPMLFRAASPRTRGRIDTGPPYARQRLALFSILLI